MKKLIKLINIILINLSSISIIGCTNYIYVDKDDFYEKDISCNYILPNLNIRTSKIVNDRKNIDNLKKWIENQGLKQSWLNITNKKKKFAENLEEKIELKASQKSINEFNLLEKNNSIFTNFDNLQYQLNNTNLGKTYVKIDWKSIINSISKYDVIRNNYKKELLRFYNIFAQVYGKNNILKILYKIQKKNFIGGIMAQTIGKNDCSNNVCSYIQVVGLDDPVFNNFLIENNYNSGWFSSKNIIESIVHEYGHVLANYICLNLEEKQNINSVADDDPNKWWNNYFTKSSNILKNNYNQQINNPGKYMISSLANDTKINDPIYQKILAYGIVRSNYGRTSINELFAEGFAQWLLTPTNQRNVAWEKLDIFFRIDLPKKVSNIF